MSNIARPKPEKDNDRYREVASRLLHGDGLVGNLEFNISQNAQVQHTEGGAFVEVMVFIPKEEL